MRGMRLTGLTLICLFFWVAAASADTAVRGSVRGHWTTAGSPYVAVENIVLNRNDTLTIDPGVAVVFVAGTQFDVNGLLSAIGTEDDSIQFTSGGRRPGDWRWLKFSGVGTLGTELAYCSVQFTEWGVHIISADPIIRNSSIKAGLNWGVKLENSRAQILDCNISDIQGNGIVIDESSRGIVRRNTIRQCSQNGIGVTGNANPVIDGNSISNVQRQGIYLTEAGICSLKYNFITNTSERGIYIYTSAAQFIQRNIIYRCQGDYSLYIYRSPNTLTINNTIYDNSRTGVGFVNSGGVFTGNIAALNGQDGIFSQNSEVTLSYNDVWQNTRNNYNGVNPGQNDISSNPDLVDPGNGDFSPREGSAVIDRGDPRYRDPDGTRSDIGAGFFNQNHPPEFVSVSPQELREAPGDRELVFSVNVRDPDGHPFRLSWFINLEPVGGGNEFRWTFRRDATYSVRVVADDGYYMGQSYHEWVFNIIGSSVGEGTPPLNSFILGVPYPNPFNAWTQVPVSAPRPVAAEMTLITPSGAQVIPTQRTILSVGHNLLTVNGAGLSAGAYYLVIKLEGRSALKPVVLVK